MARYKVLKSVAHSMGHSFTSLMNYRGNDYVMGHLLRRAREVRQGTLIVDFLTGKAGPASLLTREIGDAVERYAAWFPQQVSSQRTSLAYVRGARMTLAFDLTVEREARHAPGCIESPYVCRVEIEDDRGKTWAAELRDWWYPEAGSPPTWGPSTGAGGRSGFVRVVRRLGQLIRSVWARQRSSGGAVA
jgi:hypothetical protein